jgi:cytochrome c-type biogenesis protein
VELHPAKRVTRPVKGLLTTTMQTTILIAFLAGIISVFSPCILPIIPAYFAYISNQRKSPLAHALLFTLGFTLIFLLFGAVIGSIGQFLVIHKRTVEIVGGIIILLFALQTSGLIKLKPLLKEVHLTLPKSIQKKLENISPFKSLIAGMVFAFGWSPCYGPILGSIFTLALAETSLIQGLTLFGAYSLGMAITFVAIALLATKISNLARKTSKLNLIFKIIMTLILLALGIGMLAGNLGNIANFINSLYTEYNLNIF